MANDQAGKRIPSAPAKAFWKRPEGWHSNFVDLLLLLIVRDVKIRYKQTFLGIGWAVFQPLALMLIFTFVFSHVAPVDTGKVPYPVFAYVGLVPWQFFRQALISSTGCLIAYPHLITKIYCPREVFPIAATLSKLIDFAVAFVILFFLMLYFRMPLPLTAVWFPLLLVVQVLLMTGIGFVTSMGNLFYRDVGYVMEVLLMIWMFMTSVVYPLTETSHWASFIFQLNPLNPLFDGYRNVLIHGTLPEWKPLLYPVIVSLATCAGGYFWFMKQEPLFAERI